MASKATTFIDLWRGATSLSVSASLQEKAEEDEDIEDPIPKNDNGESAQQRAQFRQVCLYIKLLFKIYRK